MSSSLVARRGSLTALTVFAAAALCFLLFGSAGASAAPVTKGTATFTVGTGKAGAALVRSGVKVQRVAPAKLSRKGKRFVAKLPVRNLLKANRTDAPLNGGFVFRKGKRSFKVRTLNVVVQKNGKIVIGGVTQKLNGKKSAGLLASTVFKVAGKANIATQGQKTTLRIKNGKVSLAGGFAKVVRKHLGLKKVPGGQIATLNLNAVRTDDPPVDPCVADPNAEGCQPVDPCIANPDGEGCPIIDPYLAQCNVAATSQVTGSLPAATPLPVLTGAKPTVAPTSLDWGFKQSFRSYVVFGASGSLHGLNGATTVGGPPLISAFSFPAGSGEYAANDPIDTTDDQAVINGTGTAVFCATGHEFRVAVSNPTIVIDGENSRIIADVDTNLTGVWTETQRIDLAKLDVEGISPFYNKNGTQVNWGEIEATFTDPGAKAICGTMENTACAYVEDTEMDPIDLKVGTEYVVPTAAADETAEAGAWFDFTERVATQTPFPYSAQVGCVPNIPAGVRPTDANANAARTIDEFGAFTATDPATFRWVADGNQPADQPDLSGATAVNGGGLSWGVRSALRGSVNGTGQFNLSEGATASHTPYVGNGPGSLPYPQAGGTGQMSGAGKFFTWPAAASNTGFYDAGGAGEADDRLVLQAAGRVGFCNVLGAPPTIMSYGTVLSNPAIVIDGANSRITIDVATRFRNSWLRGRVDFASIDLAGATFATDVDDNDTVEVSWTGAPATLTADGASVVNVLSSGTYIEGAALDPITVKATFPEQE